MSAEFLEFAEVIEGVKVALVKANKAQADLEEKASHLPGTLPIVRSILDDAGIRAEIKAAKALDAKDREIEVLKDMIQSLDERIGFLKGDRCELQGRVDGLREVTLPYRVNILNDYAKAMVASGCIKSAALGGLVRRSRLLGVDMDSQEAKVFYDNNR
jgi:chromosome segregation ATPase